MDVVLKRMLIEMVLPPFGPFLLMGLAWLVAQRRPRTSLALAAVATMALYMSAVTGTQLLLPHPTAPTRLAPPYPDAEAIVVLGGGRNIDAPEYGGDTASCVTLERLRYAAKLYRETGKPILVSGGRPGNLGQRNEADIMREILAQEHRVPVTWAETESENTRENVAHSTRILRAAGIRRVYLVTDAYHMARAARAFDGTGVEPVPLATGYVRYDALTPRSWTPSFYGLTQNHALLYEKLASLSPL